jgi:BD-FAE protein/EF hand domain-containing protein
MIHLRCVALLILLPLAFAELLWAQTPSGQRPGDQRPSTPPTERDVHYGPHERNLLDFWQAKSEQPTPVLVAIHGGGFRMGDKSIGAWLLRDCLDGGISVVAITYRFSQQAIAPASFDDSARAIQFIRSRASQWNIDPNRIAATGGSAGAGMSLWLGFHDDMADPKSDDPVCRESTRLTCMAVTEGQTSYDPRFIRTLFPEKEVFRIPPVAQLFGINIDELDKLPAEKYKLFEACSPINFLTQDDPPVLLVYSRPLDAEVTELNVGIHHPRFGKVLKEKMDGLKIPCELDAAGQRVGGGTPTRVIAFLKENFSLPVSAAERTPAPPPVVFRAADSQGPGEQFRFWDRDHDGKLTRDEVPEMVRGVFDQVDANRDGTISPAEDRNFRQRIQNRQGQPAR